MQAQEVEIEVYEDHLVIKDDQAQFRNLVKTVSGRTISSEQAANFLELFEEELEAAVIEARRKFIEKHFGKRE